MFVPSKHEDLHKSTIVIGADIIKLLNKGHFNIEELLQEIRRTTNKEISLNQYYNVLTFLWLVEVIELNEFTIKLKN
jgi:hypothetical protein